MIFSIINENQPITGDTIAERLGLTKATLRSDLTILSMCGLIEAKPNVGYFTNENKSNKDIYEELSSIKVSDVKSLPINISESTSVYDAIVTLFLENVGTLFVVEDEILKGTVSQKDLLKVTMNSKDLSIIPVGVIMNRLAQVVTLKEDDSILEAAEKIIESEFDCLPIVKETNGKIIAVGRISKTNITKVMLEISK